MEPEATAKLVLRARFFARYVYEETTIHSRGVSSVTFRFDAIKCCVMCCLRVWGKRVAFKVAKPLPRKENKRELVTLIWDVFRNFDKMLPSPSITVNFSPFLRPSPQSFCSLWEASFIYREKFSHICDAWLSALNSFLFMPHLLDGFDGCEADAKT